MAKKETIDLSDVTAPVVTVATENLGTIDSIRDLHQSDTKINLKDNLKDKKSAETSEWSNRKNNTLVSEMAKNKIKVTHFVSQNAVGDGALIKSESKSKIHKKDNLLHKFTTYNTLFTLSGLTEDEIRNPKQYLNGQPHDIIAKSAGIGPDNHTAGLNPF